VIGGIAATPRTDSALLVQLTKGLIEGKDRMGWRSVSKLTVGLEPLELRQEV